MKLLRTKIPFHLKLIQLKFTCGGWLSSGLRCRLGRGLDGGGGIGRMADGSDLFRPLDGRLGGEGGRRFDHGRGAIQRRMIRPQGDQLVDG